MSSRAATVLQERMISGWLVVLLLSVGSVPIAEAGTIRADVNDQDYLDLADAYPSVGRFSGQTDSYSFWGSGVLINSRWVLTAAHVLDGATSLTFTIDGNDYGIGLAAMHRRWTGDLSAGYDIGLVRLDAHVPGITPANRYKAKREFGEIGTYVGYGKTGTGLTGSTDYDGKKRATQNVIDRTLSGGGQRDRVYMSDFDNPNKVSDNHYGSSTPLDLEGLIAPGDSGGGVFIHKRDRDLLVGINSFGASYDGEVDSDYGDVAGFIRVYVFNTWINNVISSGHPFTRDDVFRLADGAALVGVIPEPASLSLLVVGGGLLLRRRAA